MPEKNPEPASLSENFEIVEVPSVKEGERVVEEGECMDEEGEHLDEEGGDEVAGNLIYTDANNIQERQFPLKKL